MKLINYLLLEYDDWEPGDGMESNLLSDKLYKKWAAEQTKGEPRKKLKDMSPEFQKAWKKEHAKNDRESAGREYKRADKSSITVSPLIRGRHSVDMKAFGNAREKDPKGVAQSMGVSGGRGWVGLENAISGVAGADGIGKVITGATIVDNSGNVTGRQRKMLGILVSVSPLWAQGHEKPATSKKLVAWWIKQVLQGAFEGGLIKPEMEDKIPQGYRKADFSKWDDTWKVYEGGGGIIVFYGAAKHWNG